METEELICPSCGTELSKACLASLRCKTCKVNFRHKKFVGFLEYLMMNGLVGNVDFFDKTLYGDQIEHKTIEEKELEDYTNPGDYEDTTEKFKHFDEQPDLKEVTTDEESFRKWDGIEEEWEDFNKKEKKE